MKRIGGDGSRRPLDRRQAADADWTREIPAGAHALAIFDDADDGVSLARSFLQQGLAAGQRCLYAGDDPAPDAVAAALTEAGVDIVRAAKRRALTLMPLRDLTADPPPQAPLLLQRVRGWLAEAHHSDYAGLRAAVDLTWSCAAANPDAARRDFESLLDDGAVPRTTAVVYRCDAANRAFLNRLMRRYRHVRARDRTAVALSPMLQGLAKPAAAALLDAAEERWVARNETYYRQGQKPVEIFLLTRGRVLFNRLERQGRRLTGTQVSGPSDVFGYNSLLAGAARATSAVALEDTRALVWDTHLFRKTITAHPDVANSAIEYFIQRRIDQWYDFPAVATERVEQRLAVVLCRLMETVGRRMRGGAIIELPLSGQHLAEMAGTTAFTISRVFATWRRQRIVDARRTHIWVIDADGLTAIAGPDTEAASTAG